MLGAYLLLFPHARVLLIAPVVGATYVPAGIVLGLWFVMQLLNGEQAWDRREEVWPSLRTSAGLLRACC